MYTSYYGFSAKPFQLSPDPRFFFGSSVHKRALAYLRYGLSQAEGFIVITGGIGTGKTTLVRSLFNELDTESVVAAQLITTQLDADDLLRLVVAAFGIPHEGLNKAALIKRFEDFLIACARNGKRILLIVDEAQNLPLRSLEELRMLSNYQIADAPLLQSFLLGQEEFRTTLQAPEMEQLRQRVIASCHLNPLDLKETRGYIEHRLRVVGWRDNMPEFSRECLELLHGYSQGIPRRINVLCDRLLLYGFLEELRSFDGEAVRAVSRELEQEIVSPTQQVPPSTQRRPPPLVAETAAPIPEPAAAAAPVAAPPVAVSAPAVAAHSQVDANADIDRRLSEIERHIAMLTVQRDPQNDVLAKLEKRLEEIDSTLRSLQQSEI